MKRTPCPYCTCPVYSDKQFGVAHCDNCDSTFGMGDCVWMEVEDD